MKPAQIERILARSRWFASQPAALRHKLIARARISTLESGQWIYGTGDALNGLYAVLDGTVHMTVPLGDDDDLLLEIVRRGQLFGQAARFGGGPRLVTAIAGEHCSLLHVPDHVLHEIARTEPDMWRNFTELLYAQLAGALQLAARMIHLPPERRVAARLVMLADESVSTGPLRISVNQAQLAEMTGLSRKTVNGHLQKFARANLVNLEYGTIVLRDISRLRKHAQ